MSHVSCLGSRVVLGLGLLLAWNDVNAGERVVRDLAYGPRRDLADEGAGFSGEPISAGDGRRCHTHRSGQDFDAYLPESIRSDSPVILFIHGGGWSQRWDKDGDAEYYIRRMQGRGFLVCSMSYVLQSDVTADMRAPNREGATFANMLRDIDAMVTHLKGYLQTLGVSPRKIAIAGSSAGAHLAALYAGDGANPQALGLGLRHELEIGFTVDIIGPMDFTTPGFRRAIGGEVPALEILFRRLIADGGDFDAALAKWSPISLVNAKTPPMVMAYTKLHPFASSDGLVETENCTRMEEALEKAGVESVSRYCWFRVHGQFTDSQIEWMVEKTVEFAEKYL